jgi:murein DD-endopeptidase MepM/ murein hydrolase activator NlpD
MRGRRVGRWSAVGTAGCILIAGLVAAASADSSVQVALNQKHDLQDRIERIQESRRVRRVALHQRIRFSRARLKNFAGAGQVIDSDRYRRLRQREINRIADLRAEERALVKLTRGRIRELRSRRASLASWIESLPLQRCPVDGSPVVSDNFGVIREMPGTPRHIHQGNDIMAPTGTPIIAPFDGESVASSNYLGGQSVHVYGAEGYVYNAHLSAYGKLGQVQVGDVIGYVGVTGNATAPHNHFEWHPGDGPAVDPFVYLSAVC